MTVNWRCHGPTGHVASQVAPKVWIALLLLLGVAAPRAAGLDARWGLQWGQSVAEVQAQALGWRLDGRDGDMERYISEALPLRHPAFPRQMLIFRGGRLVEVRAFSRTFQNDPEGRDGRIAHFGVGYLLRGHYGEPDPVLEIVRKTDQQPAEGFYACLKQEGCGMWMRYWDHAESLVVLELRPGTRPQTGWLLLRAVAPGTARPPKVREP